jgi:hypothetical protein
MGHKISKTIFVQTLKAHHSAKTHNSVISSCNNLTVANQ